jgi:hypothetical protein
MFVIRGQAQAIVGHPQFSAGSIHSLLAVSNGSSADELMCRVQADLLASGFGEVRLFDIASVPVWRALLPTSQGRILRSGFSGVSITLYSDDDQNWSQPDA